MADKEDVRDLRFTEEMQATMDEEGFSFLTNSEAAHILNKEADSTGEDDNNVMFDKCLDFLSKILEDRQNTPVDKLFKLHQQLENREIDLSNPVHGKMVDTLHKFEAAAVINMGDALDADDDGGVRTLVELIPSLSRFTEAGLAEHVIALVREVFTPLDDEDDMDI